MVLPIYSVLIKIDKSLIEASEDLGANIITTFKKSNISFKFTWGNYWYYNGIYSCSKYICYI